ncbi:MAG: hypothetical protein WCI72_05440 [archaeon]
MENESSLEFYNTLVTRLIADNSTQILDFEGLSHARIVTSGLISMATKEVNVFCKSLAHPLWMDSAVSAKIKGAWERGIMFNVLVQEEDLRYGRSVFARYGISVARTTEDFRNLNKNYVACDERAYALFRPDELRGTACFNGEVIASRLKFITEMVAENEVHD